MKRLVQPACDIRGHTAHTLNVLFAAPRRLTADTPPHVYDFRRGRQRRLAIHLAPQQFGDN